MKKERETQGKKQKQRKQRQKLDVHFLHSISLKLLGSYMVMVALIIVLGVISYQKASGGIIDNYEDAMESSMNMMLRYIESIGSSAEARDTQLICNETLQKYYGGEYAGDSFAQQEKTNEVASLLHATAMTEKNISEIYVFAQSGKPIGAINNLLPQDIYQQFTGTADGKALENLSKQDTAWMGYHEDLDKLTKKTLEDYSISCARNLYDDYGTKVGYVIVDLSNGFITDTLETSNLPEGSIALFETADGRAITIGGNEDESALLEDVSASDTTEPEYISHGGKQYLKLEQSIESLQSRIVILVPRTAILKQANGVKTVTLAIVLLGIIVGMIIAIRLSRGIGTAIKRVNLVLEESAKGNLTGNVVEHRKDEFHLLSNCVNMMMDNMKHMVGQLHHASGSVSDTSGNVTQVSTALLGVSEEMRQASGEIGAAVSQQTIDVQECLDQMNLLADMIGSVDANIEQMNTAVSGTNTVIQRGIKIINELSAMDHQTATVTKQVITNVEQLNDKSKDITEFLKTIDAIAANTNLLSLNASIEAARAGEAGKGFAIVADEIRKLAAQSEEASQQINLIVQEMLKDNVETAESAQMAKDAVESQEQTLQETVDLFHQINEKVTKLQAGMEQIEEQMKHMDSAKLETLENIQNISAAIEQTQDTAQQLEINSQNQFQVVEKLQKAANTLDTEYMEIENIIHKFRVE